MKVYMYDLDGNLLKKFDSIKDAERETGIKQANIYRVCSSKKGTAGGYQFRFEKDFKQKIEKFKSDSIRHKKRKINIYDTDGNYITTTNSIQEASKFTNVLPQNILMCCKKQAKAVKGYQFRYADEVTDKKISPVKYNKHNEYIIKKDGQIIRRTNKIKDVLNILNISYYKFKKDITKGNLKSDNYEVEVIN